MAPENSQMSLNRITFLARVKRRVGDEKIDLVAVRAPSHPTEAAGQETGLVPCQNT